MTVTYSIVASRFACGRMLRKAALNTDLGLITEVKLTKISFRNWHMQFKAEVKA
jgi:hypothetical protein